LDFDTDQIATWRGLRLTEPSYRRRADLTWIKVAGSPSLVGIAIA